MIRRALVLTLTLAAATIGSVANATHAVTTCAFGGPAPGFKAIRFDLDEGTDFLDLDPVGSRPVKPLAGEDNWHLAQGLIVVNAETLAIEAYRIESYGSSPRHAVVRNDGAEIVDQAYVGPDGPFYHTAAKPRAGLPPGEYYAIGFGVDGGRTFPNDLWAFDLRIGGKHSCAPVGAGETFDVNDSDFEGGTYVTVGAIGRADGISYEMTTSRELVVGLIDVAVQLAGEAEVEHVSADGSHTVEDDIEPFVGRAGTHTFEASFQGLYPMVVLAGITVDLP